MPKLELQRSIDINAPPEKVFSVVSDLSQWRPWNPWLVTEPEAEGVVRDGGKQYSWNGKRTGAGEMRVLEEQPPRCAQMDLLFFKPFKSQARVQWFVDPEGDTSRVRWTMNSSLPLFLFFLKSTMKTMISMDYDRGLRMLKDLLETGEVPSKLEWPGLTTYPGCSYVGITTECPFEQLGDHMSADFDQLRTWQKSSGLETDGAPFSVYHEWDLGRAAARYTSGMPVATVPHDIPQGFVTGKLPSLRTQVVRHVGSYRHLGNAWSTGMQMARGKEFLQSKKHPPFELYTNSPEDTAERELRVDVHFPIK